ncbi:MAG: endolytic transglycosylase MltG [Minisyncoccia bacterium]
MDNIPSLDNSAYKLGSNFKQNSYLKIVLFGSIGIFVIVIIFYFLFLSAPNNFPVGQIINIEQGTSLRSISKDLEIKHIIKSRVAFETFVIIYGGEKHIVPGDYLFENKSLVFEVARRVSYGDHHLLPVKITIPEGFNISDISNIMSTKLLNFNKEKFLLEAQKKEGYLFPDTYFFFTTANEEDVLKAMSDNFSKKIKPIQSEINLSGKSEKDIIIMASIVEREAKGDADRGVISGILWNRLSKGMMLQVDAVPVTYKTKGLPENPISNPGIEAINAALKPENSPYLFYLHDKNGVIHYAVTFTEHKKNIARYLK